MQVKDILKLQLTDELAVVKPDRYTHNSYKSIETCRETDVVKATLVSMVKYQDANYPYWFTSADLNAKPHLQVPAPQGSKSFAFLVQEVSTVAGSEPRFALIKPKHILGLIAPAEARWVREKSIEADAENIRIHRTTISDPVIQRLNMERNETTENLKQAIATSFGKSLTKGLGFYLQVNGKWTEVNDNPYDAKFSATIDGTVQMDYDLFLALFEESMASRYDD